jgi:hypothetical protein
MHGFTETSVPSGFLFFFEKKVSAIKQQKLEKLANLTNYAFFCTYISVCYLPLLIDICIFKTERERRARSSHYFPNYDDYALGRRALLS